MTTLAILLVIMTACAAIITTLYCLPSNTMDEKVIAALDGLSNRLDNMFIVSPHNIEESVKSYTLLQYDQSNNSIHSNTAQDALSKLVGTAQKAAHRITDILSDTLSSFTR